METLRAQQQAGFVPEQTQEVCSGAAGWEEPARNPNSWFVCRSLGVHCSKVRSLTLDSWEPELLKVPADAGGLENRLFGLSDL